MFLKIVIFMYALKKMDQQLETALNLETNP